MTTTSSSTVAKRAGRMLGRLWGRLRRQEARAIAWLVAHGLSMPVARVLLWCTKLVVLGVLLYFVFWLALILVFGVVAAWVARNADWEEYETKLEWRDGWDGYGLYRGGVRVDGGSADDD